MSDLPSLHILLVEDNLLNQKVASRVLEKAGHTVTIAANGKEALVHVRDDRFDLVLMDVQMPEMDGLSATVAIRQYELGTDRHLPILALTANALIGDREKCLEAGMDHYLTKPLDALLLLRAIAETLTRLKQTA